MPFPYFRRRGSCSKVEPPSLPAHPSWGMALSAETEAFLNGQLVEQLAAAGRPVPAWAVLNKLAHASAQELADMGASCPDPGPHPEASTPAWSKAQASLASCLLRTAGAPEEVTRVQHARLIPLELWFIERSKTRTITTREVIKAASDVIDAGHHRL